jgi:hypothetical protein
MAGMAVVSIPAVPEGWHGRDLVRIVDPLGCVAAWIAPAQAGVVVGCHARLANPAPWHPIAVARTTDAAFAFEPMMQVDDGTLVPVRMLGTGWRWIERDPTGAVVQGEVGTRPVRIGTQCEDGGFRLAIEMPGISAAQLSFCLPPAWKQPPGSLALDISTTTKGTWQTLDVDFRAAGDAD